MYARILEMRWRKKVDGQIEEHQSGFRPHFYNHQVKEKVCERNIDFSLCFIDQDKVFFTVRRDGLRHSLKEHEVEKQLIEAITSFYESQHVQ